ncbi:MAG: class I SAM-dependent methyltransferase [Bryobacteraceae bacterium]|nr:class I SAM-dependent methyltransferase [Bryobacteraceae bacterium]
MTAWPGAVSGLPEAGLPAPEPDVCPLCGSRSGTVISTRDRSGGPLTNLLCGSCGLIRVTPRPGRQEHESYYRHSYRLEYKGRSLPSRRQWRRAERAAADRIAWLRAAVAAPASVLEVGCGFGLFLHLLKTQGCEVAGIEPDARCAEFARRRFGIEILGEFAETTPADGRKFECLCCFHVIEHVLDPVRFLAALRRHARPRARLLLETPNADAPFPRPRRRFHRGHLYSFSARTLDLCLRTSGWRPLSVATSPDGGNLFVIAELCEPEPLQLAPGEGEEALARWRRASSARSYYASPAVWRRALIRLGDRVLELLSSARPDPF